MKNAKKGLIIAATILLLTLGVATIKILLFPQQGFYYGGYGLLLLLPALPFIWIIDLFKDYLGLGTVITFVLATIFWLLVGYYIGKWMDKRKK